MKCPDCKDGFYYPLIGPRETCRTCGRVNDVQGNSAVKSYTNVFSANSSKHLDEQRANHLRLTRAYRKSEAFAFAGPSDVKDESSEIGHHRGLVREYPYHISMVKGIMISESTHPASIRPDPIHGVSYTPLPDIAEMVRNKRTILQAAIDAHKAQIDEGVLKEIERRNLNIQGTITGRVEQSTQPTDWSQYIPKSLTESQMHRIRLIFKTYSTELASAAMSKRMLRVIIKSFLIHTPLPELATILMNAKGTISIYAIAGHADNFINQTEEQCEKNRQDVKRTGLA